MRCSREKSNSRVPGGWLSLKVATDFRGGVRRSLKVARNFRGGLPFAVLFRAKGECLFAAPFERSTYELLTHIDKPTPPSYTSA